MSFLLTTKPKSFFFLGLCSSYDNKNRGQNVCWTTSFISLYLNKHCIKGTELSAQVIIHSVLDKNLEIGDMWSGRALWPQKEVIFLAENF